MILDNLKELLRPRRRSEEPKIPHTLAPNTTKDQSLDVCDDGAILPLLELPPEVIELVLIFLELSDRLRVIRTCSLLKYIYDQSAKLQYDFALKTTGYLDVPYRNNTLDGDDEPMEVDVGSHIRGSRSISNLNKTAVDKIFDTTVENPSSMLDRQRILLERQRRWDTLDFKLENKLDIKGPAGVYELQEGIFLMCDDYHETVEGRRPTSIRLFKLPSTGDPPGTRPFEMFTHKLPFAIADLTMDPTQDLIVIGEYQPIPSQPTELPPTHRYHLLTMSTFQPHPLATLPTLDFPPFTNQMQTRQLLQIMGDTLVILVSRFTTEWILLNMGIQLPPLAGPPKEEEEMVAWNWKTGRVLSRMTLPESSGFASFALLTPTSFMVTVACPSMDEDAISFNLEPDVVNPPIIQIYTIIQDPNDMVIPVQPLLPDDQDTTTPRPILLAQLDLPEIQPGCIVTSFDVRPDPAFPPLSKKYSGPSLTGSKPFTQDPRKGVLVFELHINPDEIPRDLGIAQRRPDPECFEMFILRETLVDLAESGERKLMERRLVDPDLGRTLDEEEEVVHHTWEVWGEDHSRLNKATMIERQWVCSCSGYRFISLDPDYHHFRRGALRAWERLINVFDFNPYSTRKTSSNPEPAYILKRGRIWTKNITTRLACRKISMKKTIEINGVMIDDERVILVNSRRSRLDDVVESQEITVLSM